MALGTLLAAFPGRRRDPLLPTSAPVPVARGAAEPEDDDTAADKVEVGV
jgi:hypothetical protein